MITIYSKENCNFCTRAKKLMESRGIAYTEKKLGIDFQIEDIREAFPTLLSFPVITKEDILVGGYDALVSKITEDSNYGKTLLKG